jgi:hypothetical protein
MSNNFTFDVCSENKEKLILLYKVVLSKKVKIRNTNEYSEKMLKFENKIMEINYSGIYCFKNIRKRNLTILHNIFYSYVFRMKAKGIARVWQEAFIEYCLMNLKKDQIIDINSVAHNIQNKIEILFEETLVNIES